MTDEAKAAGAPPQEDATSSDARPAEPRLGRRLIVLRVATGAIAAAAAAPAVAEAGDITPVQYRTGITDSDPGDGPGYGRGGYRGRPRTGLTDADPGDGPGYGRGGYRGPARTGLTDSDPGDGPGYGRGGYRAPARPQGRAYTGINDGDPGDPSGYGTAGGSVASPTRASTIPTRRTVPDGGAAAIGAT